MAETWKKLHEKIKVKKTRKNNQTSRKLKGNELTIQRLSTEVSGKAQKYARIGPREFVPIDTKEDLTIDSIKRACDLYFAHQIGTNLACDVLAGEQGPSCKTVDQIPDLKVMHIRFVGKGSLNFLDVDDDGSKLQLSELPSTSVSHGESQSEIRSEFLPPRRKIAKVSEASRSSPSKYPLSISVSQMIKLGKLNTVTPTTVVNIYKFDFGTMVWSKVPTTVEFLEEKEPIGAGAFRKAFKASSKHPEFQGSTWVIKRYIPEGIKNIEEIGLTLVDHTRKTVQMHHLAKNFASQLKQKIKNEDVDVFGEVLKYREIYYGETGDCVTVEEFIPGNFVKYINNTGLVCVDESDNLGMKAQCLTHFSFEKSNQMLMVLDVQGSGTDLFDPEIASSELFDDNARILYCAGNLSLVAITNFRSSHKCNIYCKAIGLSQLSILVDAE